MALKRNVIASYIGQGWAAAMSLAFVPIYIRYIGIESYGLIGFFAAMQAWLAILDMGMTATLRREMARFTGGSHSPQTVRDLLRSIEVVIAGGAFVVAPLIWAMSGWLSEEWLRLESLRAETVATTVALMGIVLGLRFIEGLYRSSVIGLQRQVLYNGIVCIIATIRGVGAIAVLAWMSSTITAFFLWQAAVALLSVLALSLATYRLLPKANRAGRFSWPVLKEAAPFAGGMLGITVSMLLFTQIDKIVLSRTLSLEDFGYYTLAGTVAGTLHMLVAPLVQAWYPHLTELYARNDLRRLVETYHSGAQFATVIVGSAAVVLIAFAGPILGLWANDENLTIKAATLVALLSMGNMINAFTWIPYHAQLAYGWTGLSMRLNFAAAAVMIPMVLWAATRFGAHGAASVWVLVNLGYAFLLGNAMFRKILQTEQWAWVKNDILLPLLAASIVAGVSAALMPPGSLPAIQLVWVILTGGVALISSAFSATLVRQSILGVVGQVAR